jgi:hypothetical protein
MGLRWIRCRIGLKTPKAHHQHGHDAIGNHNKKDRVPAEGAEEQTTDGRRDGWSNREHQANQVHNAR